MKSAVMFIKNLFAIAAILLVTEGNAQTAKAHLVANPTMTTIESTVKYTEKGAAIVSAYQEGVAITRKNNKYGFVNLQGYEIVDPKFQQVHLFHNGYAAVKYHGKWSFINKQGVKITSFRFDWVGDFNNAAAPVQIKGKWGLINEQGLEITEIKYDAITVTDAGQIIAKRNDSWFFIDIVNGKETILQEKELLDRNIRV